MSTPEPAEPFHGPCLTAGCTRSRLSPSIPWCAACLKGTAERGADEAGKAIRDAAARALKRGIGWLLGP